MGRLDVRIQHGHGGDGAGPWIALAVVVALALAGGAGRHAISATAHVLVTVAEVIAWTLAGAAAAAFLGAAVVAGVKLRRQVLAARARRAALPVVTVITPDGPRMPPAAARHAGQIELPCRPAAGTWPLPGWWEEIRPRIGGDSDEHRPR